MWKGIGLIYVALGLGTRMVYAQCPSVGFSAPSSACQQQELVSANTSTSATGFLWDFCTGDFNNSPTAQLANSLPYGGGRPGIELAKSGNLWVGFVTGTFSNHLYRLTYANGVSSPATSIEDLGNISGKLNNPGQLRLVQNNSKWYAFILNISSNEILQLSFGNSLLNTFAITTLVSNIPALSLSSGMSLGQDATNGWVCVVSLAANNFYVIRLGPNLLSPSPSDIITSSSTIPLSMAYGIGDVDLINNCGVWYGFADNYGSGHVFRLDFGTNLFSDPGITEVAYIPVSNLGRLRVAKDGNNYFLFVASINNVFSKLTFGTDLASVPTIVNEGNINNSISSILYGLAVAFDNSTWAIHSVDAAGAMYQIYYPDNCTATPKTSTQSDPLFAYAVAGTYNVSLTASNATGASTLTKSVVVSSLNSPDINILSQNYCVSNPVLFKSQNTSGNLTGYSWKFGDGLGTSSSQNPSYTYSNASKYLVSLSVTASNGCANYTQDSLQIYNAPQANFALPSASPICSNQTYLFTNTSTADAGSNPAWQWTVNGTAVATSQHLSYLITSAVAQTVKLTASIPGCTSQATQSIPTVQVGPLVSFSSPSSSCVGSVASFTNTTQGAGTTYAWSYGDGNASSQLNGANAFGTPGVFPVSLTVVNAAGCQNSMTKNLSVYSNPQPAFAIEAPPFSCANFPAQFDNLTPPLADSNIASWAWAFGDAGNGASTLQNPTFTYPASGTYSVSLRATSNFGCTKTVQNTVNILPSPVAAFSNGPACVNQSTLFSNASTGNISSYQWNIQSSVLSTFSPSFVFKNPGTFPVLLTVLGANGCKNQVTKSVTVPVPPSMGFTLQTPCAGQPTVFQETNPGGPDPTVAWNWNFGGGSGANAVQNFTFSSAGGYLVTLSATRQSGCVYSVSQNVNIYARPTARFAASPLAGGAPLPVTFTNQSTAADSSFWQFGDANMTTSKSTSPQFSYTRLGTYRAVLTAVNYNGIYSCQDTTSAVINVVIPRIDLAMKNLELSYLPNDGSAQAVVSVANLGNIPSDNPAINLDLGGGAVIRGSLVGTVLPGQTLMQTLATQFVPQGIDFVCAEVVVRNDADTANDKQCITLAATDVVFSPYPNPANHTVNFDWVSASGESVKVFIYHATGEVVFEEDFQNFAAGLGQLTINTGGLASGLYLVRFAGAKVQQTFRLVVAH